MQPKRYATTFGTFAVGDPVVLSMDGNCEIAFFEKVSGSGSVVVRLPNGQLCSLQGADAISRRFAVNGQLIPIGR